MMNRTKQLLISMIALLCCCTGMWASSIPGALSGRFTINASGEKVVFSQGNLQYVGTWQFAENQWDCFSTSQYNDHRDLFGWGTGDAPNKVSDNNGDYGTFTDWGTNAITNGGNTENSGWRTLTKDEWVYLFYSRKNAATLFGFGSVNSKNGLIILPDNWTTPEGASFTASTTLGLTNQGSYYHNGKEDNYTHNTYTAEQWAVMESAGAVFLPAAAYRHWVDSNIYYTDGGGFYWSSTPFSTDNAYYLNFYYNDLDPQFNEMRCGGRPVRLVRSSLEKDGEGNYLLSSADDWKDFAAIVNSGTNPAANAKMTADIDLGDDQTHIGDNNNLSYAYCGVFDGQGHKLNVNYYSSSSETTVEGGYSIAPFRNIKGATIKNLAVTGNITGYMHCAGVVGYAASPSTNLINNVTVSANITIINSHGGGFIGHNENATTTIQDCLFNGTINGKSGGSTVGVFFGWSGSATMSLINCLENGSYTNCSTFTPTSCPGYAVPTVTNCYYAVSGSYPGTHATSTTLADGTIAYKLQNNRGDLVWGQRIGTDAEPVLTNDENYRVYRGKNDYTNSPEEAYEGIQQDGEGNYLLGCLSDWQDFAEIVNSGTNAAANAKMTADIDLGDDQTMIGTGTQWSDYGETGILRFQGIFDGQGHTLTVNYNATTESFTAPFRHIKKATIKNLRVAGTITTNHTIAAGIASSCAGDGDNSYIINCVSSVDIISNYVNSGHPIYDGARTAGIIGQIFHNAHINISDCIFNGSISGEKQQVLWGGMVGLPDGPVTITNSLQIGSFDCSDVVTGNEGSGTFSTIWNKNINITNSYYLNALGAVQGTQATSAQLADGTTTTALQAGRAEIVWVQDPGTNQPMLAIFADAVTLTDGDDLTALSAYAGTTCKVAYSRSFTAGMSSTVCLPFAFAKGSVGTFYTFTGISKSGSEYIADMTEYTGANLVANTPYLFTPAATGSVDFSGTYEIPASITAGETTSGDWKFLGTYETIQWTEAPTGIYGFSAQAVDGISQGEFVKVGAYVRIRPMRCYLKYKNGGEDYAGARAMTRGAEAEQLPETIKVRLIGANGEVTAIGSLQTKTGEVTFDSDAWYTLDGVQLNGKPTRKGIYVNNGKKVVIK